MTERDVHGERVMRIHMTVEELEQIDHAARLNGITRREVCYTFVRTSGMRLLETVRTALTFGLIWGALGAFAVPLMVRLLGYSIDQAVTALAVYLTAVFLVGRLMGFAVSRRMNSHD